MTTSPATTPPTDAALDDARWRAVVACDCGGLAPFIYAVRSTGVYCRPECPSRTPKRGNIEYFDGADDARRAGYRACRRCRPDDASIAMDRPAHLDAIIDACRALAETRDSITTIADRSGLSAAHFRRAFTAAVGVSPRDYRAALDRCRLHAALDGEPNVTHALRATDVTADRATQLLGMTPATVRRDGRGETIHYAHGACVVGRVLVAVASRGVCAVSLGRNDAELTRDLRAEFSAATLVNEPALGDVVTIVARSIDADADAARHLPLDIRGTAFQQRVWHALRAIPRGETRAYRALAESIGAPTSARAVAGACAANRHALLIPCHRAVTAAGTTTGYRWHPTRKRDLLTHEGSDTRPVSDTGGVSESD